MTFLSSVTRPHVTLSIKHFFLCFYVLATELNGVQCSLLPNVLPNIFFRWTIPLISHFLIRLVLMSFVWTCCPTAFPHGLRSDCNWSPSGLIGFQANTNTPARTAETSPGGCGQWSAHRTQRADHVNRDVQRWGAELRWRGCGKQRLEQWKSVQG